MASARSASEVPRNKIGANAAAPLRKSASGATFPRLRATAAPQTAPGSETTPGEPPSPRVQTEVDASYCSYDVTNPKYVGNQSPVRMEIPFVHYHSTELFEISFRAIGDGTAGTIKKRATKKGGRSATRESYSCRDKRLFHYPVCANRRRQCIGVATSNQRWRWFDASFSVEIAV